MLLSGSHRSQDDPNAGQSHDLTNICLNTSAKSNFADKAPTLCLMIKTTTSSKEARST